MRLAVISDIHGNLEALEAVLADLHWQPDIRATLCLGDLVGYYDQPNEVCERIRSAGTLCIRGNHDAHVIGEATPDPSRDDHYRASWTRSELGASNLAWLKSLPIALEFRWGGTHVAARHASPFDEETYVYPDFPDPERLFAAVEDVLLLGHTHIPMRLSSDDKLVINPGSVGQPRDYDPRASYLVLDTESRAAEHRRVAYDNIGLANRMRARGWPESSLSILTRRR